MPEGDGTLAAWQQRRRNPGDYRPGTRVITSPKRPDDPTETGTVTALDDDRAQVRWDNDPDHPLRYDGRGQLRSYDLRCLLPVPHREDAPCS